jgi:hypothetical protein
LSLQLKLQLKLLLLCLWLRQCTMLSQSDLLPSDLLRQSMKLGTLSDQLMLLMSNLLLNPLLNPLLNLHRLQVSRFLNIRDRRQMARSSIATPTRQCLPSRDWYRL